MIAAVSINEADFGSNRTNTLHYQKLEVNNFIVYRIGLLPSQLPELPSQQQTKKDFYRKKLRLLILF